LVLLCLLHGDDHTPCDEGHRQVPQEVRRGLDSVRERGTLSVHSGKSLSNSRNWVQADILVVCHLKAFNEDQKSW
jgi:hypothetical protein